LTPGSPFLPSRSAHNNVLCPAHRLQPRTPVRPPCPVLPIPRTVVCSSSFQDAVAGLPPGSRARLHDVPTGEVPLRAGSSPPQGPPVAPVCADGDAPPPATQRGCCPSLFRPNPATHSRTPFFAAALPLLRHQASDKCCGPSCESCPRLLPIPAAAPSGPPRRSTLRSGH